MFMCNLRDWVYISSQILYLLSFNATNHSYVQAILTESLIKSFSVLSTLKESLLALEVPFNILLKPSLFLYSEKTEHSSMAGFY